MSGLLYVVTRPDGESLPNEPLKAIEKAKEVATQHFPHIADTHLQIGQGSYKGRGCYTLAYANKSGGIPKVAVQEREQRWFDIDQDRAVGYWLKHPPIPHDMERPETFNSKVFWIGALDKKSDDKTWWSLPIIPTDLPKTWSFQAKGWKFDSKLLDQLMPQCKRYYDMDNLGRKLLKEQEALEQALAKDVDSQVRKQHQDRVDKIVEQLTRMQPSDEERVVDAMRILSINYYITEWEAELLDIITPETLTWILMQSTQDKSAIEAQLEAEKKSQQPVGG